MRWWGWSGFRVKGWRRRCAVHIGEFTALKKFARAHRAGRVKGPPTWLLTLRIPATYAVEHILKKDIKVMTDRPEKTVGFLKPVNAYNFPRMQPTLTHIDTVGVPESLLELGRKLLERV